MENLETIRQIIGTLNLESTTTVQILHELMPLLWWKLVWLPILEGVGTALIIIPFVGFFMWGMWKLVNSD